MKTMEQNVITWLTGVSGHCAGIRAYWKAEKFKEDDDFKPRIVVDYDTKTDQARVSAWVIGALEDTLTRMYFDVYTDQHFMADILWKFAECMEAKVKDYVSTEA